MALTEAQRRAKQKYSAKGKRLTIDFYPSESDIIERLEQIKKNGGGVATYIKSLIRADIEAKK